MTAASFGQHDGSLQNRGAAACSIFALKEHIAGSKGQTIPEMSFNLLTWNIL